MVRYTGPKNRIARRFGANIFGRLRNPLIHKANPPGMHGAKKKKKSDYGAQLQEQQKLKAVYGMLTSTQLVRYYAEAISSKGNTPAVFTKKRGADIFLKPFHLQADGGRGSAQTRRCLAVTTQIVCHD